MWSPLDAQPVSGGSEEEHTEEPGGGMGIISRAAGNVNARLGHGGDISAAFQTLFCGIPAEMVEE